jgi:hypothetical protein
MGFSCLYGRRTMTRPIAAVADGEDDDSHKRDKRNDSETTHVPTVISYKARSIPRDGPAFGNITRPLRLRPFEHWARTLSWLFALHWQSPSRF